MYTFMHNFHFDVYIYIYTFLLCAYFIHQSKEEQEYVRCTRMFYHTSVTDQRAYESRGVSSARRILASILPRKLDGMTIELTRVKHTLYFWSEFVSSKFLMFTSYIHTFIYSIWYNLLNICNLYTHLGKERFSFVITDSERKWTGSIQDRSSVISDAITGSSSPLGMFV